MRRYALLCTVLLLFAFLDILGRFPENPYYSYNSPEVFSEEVQKSENTRHLEKIPSFLDSVLKEGKITSSKVLNSENGEINRYDIILNRGRRRLYLFPDGSIFLCEKSNRFSLSVEGFREITHLSENPSVPVVITGDNGSVVVQPPLARATALFEGQNFIMAGVEGGSVSFDEEKNSFDISFDGALCDWWMYYTPEVISDISPLILCTVEKFGIDNRMTLDGYYYESPPLYTPSGDYLFYRIPAPHIAVKLVIKPEAEKFRTMGIGMLDIQRGCLNSEGYVPTPSLCTWLYEDYGVGHDFYDTRFNTDFARAMLLSDVEELRAAAEKYADFFIDYAKTHNYETENGILVEDYSHPDGNDKTNASLNHNAAEILFLLDTEDKEAAEVAYKILAGIEDTVDGWIMKDKNLNYAIYPDESFGGSDYVYLTYNDLLALDKKLGGNKYLKKLMDSKREYLISNGYNEYDK